MAETCSRCENKLNREERESPQTDACGDVICEECYHDKYEFACCCCQDYGHVDDQHKMLVVFKETSGITPGIYRIKSKPYYTSAMIGSGWLWPESLERIADVNPDMDGGYYPCGHLCAGCQAKVAAQRIGRCSVCRKQSPSCARVKLGRWLDVKARKYEWSRPKLVCAGCRHAHRGSWKLVKDKVANG